MQQIADWLEQLGMSEYARCFAENKIDFSVLPPAPPGQQLNPSLLARNGKHRNRPNAAKSR